MKIFFTNFLLLLLLGATAGICAQDSGKLAIDYLQKEYAVFGLEASDVTDIKITDNYPSPNGTRHIYVAQRLHGLPIINAAASLHFRGDRLVHRTSDLATNLASVLPTAPAFSAQTAAGKAVNEVTSAFGVPVAIGTDELGQQLFSWEEVSPEAIKVSSGWYVTEAGLRLVYRVLIDQHAAHSDYWDVIIDAVDGRIIDQDNMVLKCSFGTPNRHQHDFANGCKSDVNEQMPVSEQLLEKAFTAPAAMAEESRYHVFPFGVESPIHGERTMEVSPAHPIASPFGWHDTNGIEGAEYTTTRGNNTWSYPDRDGDNNVETDVVAEGGDSLVFDFFYAPGADPDTLLQAAMAQTFYTTNKMHDWLYVAGFDEAAGNFQRKNYTDEGEDRDEVLVEAQDGSRVNNATFSTPADGGSGRMQMFLWTSNGDGSAMQVTAPESISGRYATGLAGFGPAIDETPLTGQVAISDPADGCTEVTNDLTGQIALVTRGGCNFSLKVFNAQEAGAIAAIICNDAMAGAADGRGGLIGMSDGDPALDKRIPSVFITFEACVELRNRVVAGDSVSVTFQNEPPPPVDGDFDNGIVKHEMGHGVSNRLVGGPNTNSCLNNDEQMGEGWSDFFTVAATPLTNVPNPDGSEARGTGNYVLQNSFDGRGIRNFPYSTDMSINPQTYDDIINAFLAPDPDDGSPRPSVHALGEIWNTMLWDLYWALSNRDGLDEDLIDGTGGNNLAVQLVIEGMKRTKCRPGLVDGRDGILAADFDLYDGANSCLIWEVFARRGLGFSASQGSGSNDRTDGREAFDISPACFGGVQLTKTADVSTINAGEGVTFTLKATSYREEATDKILITDIIPDGMTLEENSIRGIENWTIDGQTLTFDLGTMDFEDEETILYSVSTDPTLGSDQTYFDGAEAGDNDWDILSLNVFDPDNPITDIFWEVTDTTPYTGEFSWYVVNAGTAQDQVLQTTEALPITGDNPGLRFFTKYETEIRWDAGLVEVSTDGNNWDRVDDKLVRGRYRGEVNRNGSAALLGTNSFWGDSDGFQEIIVDLADYAGQDLFIRWRFISDQSARGRGWWVDDIEILDMVNYDGTATLTSDAGDNWPANVDNYGVLAVGGTIDNTNDPVLGQTDVRVYPNPADQFVTVNITTERAGDANLQLLSIDGRVLHNTKLNLIAGGGRTTINTATLPAGIYVVRVTGADRISTTKITIN
ncbi:M36 family metallopeptidase [Neolewinella persica]|uniref:M36 family metallopeptidase n=1 Tax=Neolewinella persica TaxID=70998 RepID=UPI00037B62BE|nr:M36 family metallopeptidase [Neolewinella persica]